MLTCDISSLLNALKLPATTHRKGDESSGKRKGGAPSGTPGDKRNIQGQINRPCGFDCFQEGPTEFRCVGRADRKHTIDRY